jgi:ribosome recycling factor
MVQLVLEEATEKMADAVAHTRREFSTVRTGRASSSMVENLTVAAYGVDMRMQELASFSVPEPRQLMITPHDPANVTAVERAVVNADLGLAPSNDGRTIRLSFPELTEERRRDMVRMINRMAEEARITSEVFAAMHAKIWTTSRVRATCPRTTSVMPGRSSMA